MVCQVPSPVQILFIDRLLKGDKGDPGSSGTGDAAVQEHEAMYDHGDLHEHNNFGLLQSFTYTNDSGLFVYGRSAYPAREVYLSYNTYSWILNGDAPATLVTTPHEVFLDNITPGDKEYVVSVPEEALANPNTTKPPTGEGGFTWAGPIAHGAVSVVPDTVSPFLFVAKIFGFNLYISTGWRWVAPPPPPDYGGSPG